MIDQLDHVAVRITNVGIVVPIIVPDLRSSTTVVGYILLCQMGYHTIPIDNFYGKVIFLKIHRVRGLMTVDLRCSKLNPNPPKEGV